MQQRRESMNETWQNLGQLAQNLRKATAKMRDRNSQTASNEVQKLSVVFTTIAQNFVLKCSTQREHRAKPTHVLKSEAIDDPKMKPQWAHMTLQI